MKKTKTKLRARILKMKTERTVEEQVNPSEVARSLFSETWRNYLDEVKIVAVTLNKKGVRKIKQKRKKTDQTKSARSSRLILKKGFNS